MTDTDLDAIEARHEQARKDKLWKGDYFRATAHADRAALLAEVRKLREALAAFVEFDEMHVSAKRPDVFQLIVRRARQALKGTQP